jgi:hypothetical protein
LPIGVVINEMSLSTNLHKRLVALEQQMVTHKHGWSPRLPDDPPLPLLLTPDPLSNSALREDIETMREDISLILDRLERLEL